MDDTNDNKNDIAIIINEDENDDLPPLMHKYAYNDAELLNFKLADIAIRFGIEKRRMVESQMLNLCISLERELLQKQL